MFRADKLTALPVVVLSILLVACGSESSRVSNSPQNSNANSIKASNSPKDDAEELRSLIQIPFEAEEVIWRNFESGGKNKLVAVFVVTPETRKAYEAKVSNGRTGENVKVAVEQWFPAELTSMAEVAGETSVPGVAFPAADFYQAPFEAGSVVFIPQTDHIVLELSSK